MLVLWVLLFPLALRNPIYLCSLITWNALGLNFPIQFVGYFSLYHLLLCLGILIYSLIFSRRGESGRQKAKSCRKKGALQRETEVPVKAESTDTHGRGRTRECSCLLIFDCVRPAQRPPQLKAGLTRAAALLLLVAWRLGPGAHPWLSQAPLFSPGHSLMQDRSHWRNRSVWFCKELNSRLPWPSDRFGAWIPGPAASDPLCLRVKPTKAALLSPLGLRSCRFTPA